MTKTFELHNVKCGGCAQTLRSALEKEGFAPQNINLEVEPRQVTLDIDDEAHEKHFREVVRGLGYPVTDEEIGAFTSTALKAKSFVSCAVGKFDVATQQH
ncbi:MAG: heavy metal transporter [Sulfuricurvum sp. PC08-66]|nr:MAG: heavy metal transporter [Sulfuricurvum sp. PC08-66]